MATRFKEGKGHQYTAEFCPSCDAQLIYWRRVGAIPRGICPLGSYLTCRKCGHVLIGKHAWSARMTKQATYTHSEPQP